VVRLATRTWGEGASTDGRRPLAVLVHGVISSSRTWWRVAPALVGRGFEVLTVDLRGHGASPPVRAGLGLPDLAAARADSATRAGAICPGAGGKPDRHDQAPATVM